MIKTLYIRFVLMFIGAVLIGLISSFFITISTLALLQEEIVKSTSASMEAKGRQIVRIYEEYGLEGAGSHLDRLESVNNYEIKLFNKQGLVQTFGPERNKFVVEPASEDIVRVLNGVEYRSANRDKISIIGLPVRIGQEQYALLLQPSQLLEEKVLRWIVLFSLGVVLLVGSLCSIAAARYLVKPLRVMQEATRRIAKGDFDIEFGWKTRHDELGELARSFSDMTRSIKRMEQMRQDFVSNVSHEIQTPLTSISGFSKALRRGTLPEEERGRYLDIIQAESERLSRLSEDLLKLASLESEHHPFEPRTYDLDEQIRTVVVACEPQWSAKSISFELDLPRAKIRADEDGLRQVWINLLGNAIKFTAEGGDIAVSIRHQTDRIEVIVADNGIGISREDQEHMFDRFFKADRSHNKRISGSGLGLAIVKRIVTLHEGTIEVDSEPGAARQ